MPSTALQWASRSYSLPIAVLVGNYDCALRSLVEKVFANDSFWKYEGRTEVAFFVRADTNISLRANTDNLETHRRYDKHEIKFDARMSNEEFEANQDEIVRACGLLSDALLTFTRTHLNYRARPAWRISRTTYYE